MKTSSDFSISLVIPNYNGLELLSKNLPSLLKARQNSINNIKEIIIVDDASNDESVKFVKNNYPEIKIIRHAINRGYSASVNSGVGIAKSNFIALLNTDISVTDDFLKTIKDSFTDQKVFAISLHEKGEGYSKGAFIDGFIQTPRGQEVDGVHETFYVSGGGGVFRRNLWIKLGGMDDKLLAPFYWEDIDLSYRAAKRGYKLYWNPNANIFHSTGSTIGKMPRPYVVRILERNRLLVIWKNLTSQHLMKKHLVGLVKRLISHPGYIIPILMALKKISILLVKRKVEIRESVISDEVLFSRFS